MTIRIEQEDAEHPTPRPKPPKPATRRTSSSGRAGRSYSALVPAAAAGPRKPTALKAEELDLSGAAIETFATAVGGRAKLLATLAVADCDANSDKVINCLLDPAYARWSLRRICAYAGLTVADLFASYKKALFVQAHIDAAHRITSALPPIVDDVMRRAQPMPITCPHCDGRPTLPGTSDCPICKATGTILSEPDLDRQKLALELGRLTQQKGGMVVQQNQIAATTQQHLTVNSSGSLEQLQQAVSDLLFSRDRRRAASPAAASSSAVVVVEAEAPADREVRDDPQPLQPRFPHEEEPPLPFPDPDEDDEDRPDRDDTLRT